MLPFLPPYLPPWEDINDRPSSFTGRRTKAEKEYSVFYNHFGTHDFLEWVGDAKGEQYMRNVPPYCERFDEFLAFWMGFEDPMDLPALLESMFPDYDAMDLDYFEDVLVQLDGIASWGKTDTARKGSGLSIGPGFWRFEKNLARAKRWLESAKEALRYKQHLLIEHRQISQSTPKAGRHTAPPDMLSPWEGLFMNGFTIERLTEMLIVLGMLTEDREYTADSKPRSWRAVIEALRDNKRLSRADAPRLHKALITEFGEGAGIIPSPRTIQDTFASKNADVKQLYKQADAWLKTN